MLQVEMLLCSDSHGADSTPVTVNDKPAHELSAFSEPREMLVHQVLLKLWYSATLAA